ncbi:MAG: ABC transporter permease [Dehalococcoidia bacterium]
MRLLRDSSILMNRTIREQLRNPALLGGNIFIPLFFFFVNLGVFKGVAAQSFGVADYAGFALPSAILQAISNASAGQGLVQDMQRGYFDKLTLTTTPRPSLVLGRMASDALLAVVLSAIIMAVGLAAGARIESGVGGAFLLLAMGAVFALAYGGIGVALALKTGSPQMVQLSFLLFFPLLFLSPAFAPKEVFTGWMEFLATINPVTYVLEGMRSLVLDGWEGEKLARAFISIAGFGVFTLSLATWAYRSRYR